MATGQEKGEGKGFRVEDRRRFSAESDAAPEETASKGAEPEREEKPAGSRPAEQEKGEGENLPEITFSTFVFSLSTQALMHLGKIANPVSGKVETDLPMAKQLIDIIGILRDKTRGNLDEGEEKLMENILYDLRMRYVETVNKQ